MNGFQSTDRPLMETWGEGSRWPFPPRSLIAYRHYGWIGIAVGTVTTTFMTLWMAIPSFSGVRLLLNGQWFGIFFIAFASPGLAGLWMGLKILTAGIAVLRDQTRCLVELSDTTLRVRERMGWMKTKREIEINQIESLSVGIAQSSTSPQHRSKGWAPSLPGTGELTAKTSEGHFPIIIGYPEEMLRDFAAELIEQLHQQKRTLTLLHRNDQDTPKRVIQRGKGETSHSTVALVDASDDTTDEVQAVAANRKSRFTKPASCKIIEHRRASGMVYEVPATGLWKSNGGLMFFAVLWNGFMALFTSLSVGMLWPQNQWTFMLFLSAFLLLFWGIGVFLIGVSILRGTRATMIGLMDGMLFIETKSIFGKNWRDMDLHDVKRIEVAASGMEVNNVPIQELKISVAGKGDIGLLSELKDNELEWLAQRLRTDSGIENDSNLK